MSHRSSNAAIVENTAVVINIINTNVENGKFHGVSTVGMGSDTATLEIAMARGLHSAMAKEWKDAFPGTPKDPDSDVAFLFGPALLTIDMNVPHAVDAINTYLNCKNIVASQGFAQNVVHTALLNLVQSGGRATATCGTDVLGPRQRTHWAVATAPGKYGAGGTAGTIVAYAFTAVAG